MSKFCSFAYEKKSKPQIEHQLVHFAGIWELFRILERSNENSVFSRAELCQFSLTNFYGSVFALSTS